MDKEAVLQFLTKEKESMIPCKDIPEDSPAKDPMYRVGYRDAIDTVIRYLNLSNSPSPIVNDGYLSKCGERYEHPVNGSVRTD